MERSLPAWWSGIFWQLPRAMVNNEADIFWFYWPVSSYQRLSPWTAMLARWDPGKMSGPARWQRVIVGAESPILILDLKTQAAVTSRVLVTSNESQIIENKFRVNIHSCGNHYQIIYSNLLIIVSVHLRFFFMEMLKKKGRTLKSTKFLLTSSSANTQTCPLYTTVCTHTYTETGSQTGYALQTRYKSWQLCTQSWAQY